MSSVLTSPPLAHPHEPVPVRKNSIPLYVPLLLAVPALIPLIWDSIRAWSTGLVPTGFIQYDMPYYLANARQHFAGGFHLTYSNPYAPYGSPPIYFQPHILLLGVLQKMGLTPGVALNLFGLAAMVFASIVAARLYQEVVGWGTTVQRLGLVCFFWGGGVLSQAGLIFGLKLGDSFAHASMLFDAGDGWWMLNFGRNLVYPTEAYYHGIFLLTLLMLIRGRRGVALVLTAIMAASHPFTGLSLALIVTAYAAIELLLSSRAASRRLLAGGCAIVAAHLAYYQLFLNRFPDHRALRAQWELDWPYTAWTFGPALYIVGFLAFMPMTRWRALKQVIADPRMRLFLVCFAVVFGLTQHDLLIKPVQPLHFAHGYDWIALFFLAAPALMKLLDKLLQTRKVVLRYAAVGAFLLWMLSDNILWFATFRDPGVQRYSIALTRDQKAVLDWLGRHPEPRAVVATDDEQIGYLTSTYSDLRSVYGHVHNTPHAIQRKEDVFMAFEADKFLDAGRPVYYIPAQGPRWTPPPAAREVFRNGSYVIWLDSDEGNSAGRNNYSNPQQ